jgi:hypothetical protein
MKTLTIISALSLALIITGVNAGFAKQNEKSGDPRLNPAKMVRYQVNINLEVIKTLCNTYQVEVLNANGNPVAPPQVFDPGTKSYIFEEQTRQAAGIRIARLVMYSFGDHFVCAQELFTTPAVRLLNFKDGQFYFFDLYPSARPSKEN